VLTGYGRGGRVRALEDSAQAAPSSHHTNVPRLPSLGSGCQPQTSAHARTRASPLPSSRSRGGVKGWGGSGGEGSASQAPIRRTPVPDQCTRRAAGPFAW